MLLGILPFPDVLVSIGGRECALAMFLAVLVPPDVLVSIGPCECALAMSLVSLPSPDVLASTGRPCTGAVTIIEIAVRWTRWKCKTLSHNKQTSQQDKNVFHLQIVPYIRRAITEAIV